MAFYVYIVASARNGTIYIGMTNDLARRVLQHKEKINAGFTAKYDCKKLVWYEAHDSREVGLTRERPLKEWRRS